ncbi:hypothetical protein EHP00_429 [Ecytonucleospora hepatopenaei]|uniref:Uncharacterized protein n=1 Tax=Ecytonucleospora hepatopenaei TaxID=646526 RepID=A0A1W0E8Q6_9MICR|nr:hypothetical protein EHP00_429 [Ecytonucleospora hepatopenaei]
MKFECYIEGDFTHVKGCLLIPRFEIKIECGCCKKIKENIRIDGNKTVEKEFAKNKDPAKYNFTIKCECGTDICVNVSEPENKIKCVDKEGENEIKICPVENEKCVLMNFWSEGGVVTDVDNVQLTVVADTLERFENVDIKKQVVAEQKDNHQCFIENFKLKVIQVN